MSSSRRRGPFALLARAAVFALIFCAFAEFWFTTAMPACEAPGYYQQQPATVFRFDPFGPRTGLTTLGRLCLRGGEWRIDNAGWNSDTEYLAAGERKGPLIALFGDSYIEGFLTDPDQHVDAYLQKLLPGTAAYAFGEGGWYLEQYVAVSRYASERFQPDVLVVFVGDFDVRDSLTTAQDSSPYLWQIRVNGDSFEEIPPATTYETTRTSRLAKKSALIRYLRYNAKLVLPGARAGGVAKTAPTVATPGRNDVVPTPASERFPGEAWKRLVPAARFMVDRLCADHPGTPIVFIPQTDRYLPVADIAKVPLFSEGRAVKAATVQHSQCYFLDSRYAFSRDWAAHHVRFEAADGGHWNAYANRLVARTLAVFLKEHGLVTDGQPPKGN